MQRLIVIALFLSLSACGKAGNYPSLNPRPIEAKASGLLTEPVADSVPLAPASPGVRATVDSAVNAAQAGDVEFNRALSSARSTAQGAGASGSESWIAAQMAISALERSRRPVKAAMSDLDGALRAVLSGPPSEDLALVEGAMRKVETIDARQNEAMAALLRAVSR